MNYTYNVVFKLVEDGRIAAQLWSSWVTMERAVGRLSGIHYKNPAGCYLELSFGTSVVVSDAEAMLRWFHKVGSINEEELEQFLIRLTLKMAGD